MWLWFQGDTATQSSKEIDLMLSVNVKGECWVEFDVLHAKLACSLLGRLCGCCGLTETQVSSMAARLCSLVRY